MSVAEFTEKLQEVKQSTFCGEGYSFPESTSEMCETLRKNRWKIEHLFKRAIDKVQAKLAKGDICLHTKNGNLVFILFGSHIIVCPGTYERIGDLYRITIAELPLSPLRKKLMASRMTRVGETNMVTIIDRIFSRFRMTIEIDSSNVIEC